MPFYFQQFTMEHSRSSMKIGTDALLLAALLPAKEPKNILEIGVGCGVISLLLAQRYPLAHIHGVEIDFASVSEAKENYARSPFKDRISVQHIALQNYAAIANSTYDVVVSNPPYFSHSLKPPAHQRSVARHSDETLSFDELFRSVSLLLPPQGTFSFIIPHIGKENVLQRMSQHGFHIQEDCIIYSLPCKPVRHILTVTQIRCDKTQKSLCLRNNHGDFTSEYKKCMAPYLTSLKQP